MSGLKTRDPDMVPWLRARGHATLRAAAVARGVPPETLRSRLQSGWTWRAAIGLDPRPPRRESPGRSPKYPVESILAAARTCSTAGEFRRRYRGEHAAAQRRGLLKTAIRLPRKVDGGAS